LKNFDTRAYNVSDFVEWNSTGLLNLSPQYQRRSVWTEKAKSYLIDTIVRGKPIPKILITQTLDGGRNVRTVVDGQQRIRTILDFIAGNFKISRAHNRELAGSEYDDLTDELKNEFLKYEIGVDMIFDQSYEDILDIFARLNTYSVKLNPQELLNASYLGFFKQTAYSLGYKYVRYFLQSGVLSEKEITRMAEAELSSDLLGLFLEGVQSKKNIPMLYKKYDDDDSLLISASENFDTVMSYIGEIYSPEELKSTNYKRIHLFYSLFCSVAHTLFGIQNLNDVVRPNLTANNIGRAKVRLDEISARYDQISEGDVAATQDYLDFIEASRRGTTDLGARKYRSKFLCEKLNEVL
jgi:hypothetical protein